MTIELHYMMERTWILQYGKSYSRNTRNVSSEFREVDYTTNHTKWEVLE